MLSKAIIKLCCMRFQIILLLLTDSLTKFKIIRTIIISVTATLTEFLICSPKLLQ